MNPSMLALFSLLNPEHIALLEADAVGLYATIAHGEGGLGKVLAGVESLLGLVKDAADGAVPQQVVTPPVITPAPAA